MEIVALCIAIGLFFMEKDRKGRTEADKFAKDWNNMFN